MPTNVTAEYAAAELEYSKADTTTEKIKALEKMLATVPKHKGTEKLQKDIKTKIAKFKRLLKKEAEQRKKGFSLAIKKEGAAQIILAGPPNTGKSLLLSKLTNAKPEIADYEFTTVKPEIGTLNYHGVKLQVVEIPAIIKETSSKGKGPQFFSIIRSADLVLLIIDESSDISTVLKEFKKSDIHLNKKQPDMVKKEDRREYLPAIIIMTKTDLPGSEEFLENLRKDYKNFEIIPISLVKNQNLDFLKDKIWSKLSLIRIYTKEPGKKLKKDEPVCLKKTKNTIKDMAEHIHKDFIEKFRYARIWGASVKHPGSQVGIDHKLHDKDIVELHLK
ncbi:50S ribosome-binding GTPase [Candidatus Woesearchaeota archaeon]|nr:50S ribosome-binding GTPase [Candidatus Woesearchaeota archaeon]